MDRIPLKAQLPNQNASAYVGPVLQVSVAPGLCDVSGSRLAHALALDAVQMPELGATLATADSMLFALAS